MQSHQGLKPLLQRPDEKPVSTMFNDGKVRAHRSGDDRTIAGHVLYQLVSAFPAAPFIIRQRHDSDMTACKMFRFVGGIPWDAIAIQPANGTLLHADEQQSGAEIPAEAPQGLGNGLQILGRERRADPTNSEPPPRLGSHRIVREIHDSRDGQHRSPAAVARPLGEEIIACNGQCRPSHKTFELLTQDGSDNV